MVLPLVASGIPLLLRAYRPRGSNCAWRSEYLGAAVLGLRQWWRTQRAPTRVPFAHAGSRNPESTLRGWTEADWRRGIAIRGDVASARHVSNRLHGGDGVRRRQDQLDQQVCRVDRTA